MSDYETAYKQFLDGWQDIIGPSRKDCFAGGYFAKQMVLEDRLKKAESERDERYTKAATSVICEEQEMHTAEMKDVLAVLQTVAKEVGVSRIQSMDQRNRNNSATLLANAFLDKYRHYLDKGE